MSLNIKIQEGIKAEPNTSDKEAEEIEEALQIEDSNLTFKKRRSACKCSNCTSGSLKKTHSCSYVGCDKEYRKTSHLKCHILKHEGNTILCWSEVENEKTANKLINFTS